MTTPAPPGDPPAGTQDGTKVCYPSSGVKKTRCDAQVRQLQEPGLRGGKGSSAQGLSGLSHKGQFIRDVLGTAEIPTQDSFLH